MSLSEEKILNKDECRRSEREKRRRKTTTNLSLSFTDTDRQTDRQIHTHTHTHTEEFFHALETKTTAQPKTDKFQSP